MGMLLRSLGEEDRGPVIVDGLLLRWMILDDPFPYMFVADQVTCI
jgi:hypothetical protein